MKEPEVEGRIRNGRRFSVGVAALAIFLFVVPFAVALAVLMFVEFSFSAMD